MAAQAGTSDDDQGMIRAPTWVLPIAAALLSGIVSYFVGQVGLEHRLTTIEDKLARHDERLTGHDTQFANVWCAIHVNHGERCQP